MSKTPPQISLKIDRKLRIVTVCGVGMGSCLILRMTTEDVLKELGIPKAAKVEGMDLVQAHGAGADIILAQSLHTSEMVDSAPYVISIDDFVSKDEIREKLLKCFKEAGWLEEK
ncbi:MAG: PTS sugar transporter subunit IIB [Candidatus Bathyarchaeota archaeon]|nr:PTS sugar transporter subunit IIB [Candidatus Bathyarchaeota archaeon]